MNKIHNNILETIGNTPIFSIGTINTNYIFGKSERFNPTGTMYDRIANILINSVLHRVNINTCILCAVHDEFGLSIAMVCAVNKLSCTIVSTQQLNKDIQQNIRQYGAVLDIVQSAEQIGKRQQELFDSDPVNTVRLDSIDEGILDAISHNIAREIYSQIVGVVNVVIMPMLACLSFGRIIDYFAGKKNNIKVLFASMEQVGILSPHMVYTTIEDQYNSVADLYGRGVSCGNKSGAVWATVKQYAKTVKDNSILAVLVD